MLAVDYEAPAMNAKYCVQNMLRELQESELGRKFLDAQTLEQICDVFEMKEYCKQKQREHNEKGVAVKREAIENGEGAPPPPKKLKISEDAIEDNIAFIRSNYLKDIDLPKQILHGHTKLKLRTVPRYQTEQNDKLFRSVLTLCNKKYSSTFWEKNKKSAEQGAAMVCMLHLGLLTRNELIENGSINIYETWGNSMELK